MKLLDYDKFMAKGPISLGTIYGAVIELYEHPIYGDEYPVVGANHLLKLAFNTGFYAPESDAWKCEAILEDFQQILIDMGRVV